MKKILFIVLFMVHQTGNTSDWPSGISEGCKPLFLAYEKNDLNFIRKFDQTAGLKNRELCKPHIGQFNNYKDDAFYYSCNALYKAGVDGNIEVLKQFNIAAKPKEREVCMRHAAKQMSVSEDDDQFNAFRYIVDRLITMNLQDQQNILNELLAEYSVIYLSSDPRYTEYLLHVGASPVLPGKDGAAILVSALWIVNDYGSCETPRLLIDKLTPQDLSLQYINGSPHLAKGRYSTPLMDSVDVSPLCPDEKLLIARKAVDLNKQDANGNTVLHYLFIAMINRGSDESDITMLEILLRRGASLEVLNSKKITPKQLRIQLKNNKDKCHKFCERI